jgi:hypothetical protein
MALANDCMRGTEFSDELVSRIEELCDGDSKEAACETVRTSVAGFLKISKRAQQVLVDVTMNDVNPALKVMFCDQWYEQDVMKLIIGTFEDYADDFQKHLSDYLYQKVSSELLDKFLVSYLEAFRNKNAKFKMPIATERMKTDVETCINYFSKSKNAKRVVASFEVIQKIIALLESNPRMLYLDFYNLYKTYPDVPIDYIEKLLSKRDDMDKASVRDLMDTVKTRMKDEKVEAFQPSLFSKLNPKG